MKHGTIKQWLLFAQSTIVMERNPPTHSTNLQSSIQVRRFRLTGGGIGSDRGGGVGWLGFKSLCQPASLPAWDGLRGGSTPVCPDCVHTADQNRWEHDAKQDWTSHCSNSDYAAGLRGSLQSLNCSHFLCIMNLTWLIGAGTSPVKLILITLSAGQNVNRSSDRIQTRCTVWHDAVNTRRVITMSERVDSGYGFYV